VVLNASQLHWTMEAEKLLSLKGNEGLREHYELIVSQLNDMVFLLRGHLSNLARQ
jgi:hypothetical protein